MKYISKFTEKSDNIAILKNNILLGIVFATILDL